VAQTLHTLYRISDSSNVKAKLPHADKFYCLRNFIDVFGKDGLIIFADNCSAGTIALLQQLDVPLVTSALGNAESFLAILDFAIKRFPGTDSVYFVEDDYLHKPGAKALLLEGLAIADYVTLYDHPDKYIDFGKGSLNHFISGGGEETKVLLTNGSHWKRTNSTTMTFGAHMDVLREDYREWSHFKTNDYGAFQRLAGSHASLRTGLRVMRNRLSGTSVFNPRDYGKIARTVAAHVMDIVHRPKRTLIVSLPGRSTHIELKWLTPLTDWHNV
jgi:hypothetical protein